MNWIQKKAVDFTIDGHRMRGKTEKEIGKIAENNILWDKEQKEYAKSKLIYIPEGKP